ncbi:MAG: ribulose-phosphate 3-epimerase [Bacteroidetes bacterium]|nr:ribulose-phosphate 3-epimerase [Bacteroidota bacterium]
MAIIAPSLLSANFLQLNDACDMINHSEAEWLHLDVMDGRFVPNISFGIPVISAVRKANKKVCDVHLMIEEPEKFTQAFKDAGADVLTVHVEACNHLHRNIQHIKSLGMKAGVAINPHTPLEALKEIIGFADLICVMSVNPGFGGQQFINATLNKIERLKNLIIQKGAQTLIEVDGGVTIKNATDIVKAGADVLVAGNTVFNSNDPIATIKLLKSI